MSRYVGRHRPPRVEVTGRGARAAQVGMIAVVGAGLLTAGADAAIAEPTPPAGPFGAPSGVDAGWEPEFTVPRPWAPVPAHPATTSLPPTASPPAVPPVPPAPARESPSSPQTSADPQAELTPPAAPAAKPAAPAKPQPKPKSRSTPKRAATSEADAEKSTKSKTGRTGKAKTGTSAEVAAKTGTANVLGIASGLSGIPYVWGGTSTRGFDCSGFTQHVFGKAGVDLPRTAAQQQRAVRRVSTPRLGDLVFFGAPAHHVGIYAGQGRMYDSPRRGRTTGLHKIWSRDVSYGRP